MTTAFGYFAILLLGILGGAFCAFIAMQTQRAQVARVRRRNQSVSAAIVVREAEIATRRLEAEAEFATRRREATESLQKRKEEHTAELNALREQLVAKDRALGEAVERLRADQADFQAKVISYNEVLEENATVKRDLRNLHLRQQKLALDAKAQADAQQTLDERARELGGRYLKENVKWISASISADNYAACKQKLIGVIERCRGIGFAIANHEEAALLADLKAEFEKAVRADVEREEQARIKSQIRKELAREREIDRELKQVEREREAIQAALEKALADTKDQHSAEIERLRARLAEAEAKAQRTLSQAQLTKSGHIYVISNIGSFGEGVFKIGMTRRLEPQDRVKELGDASVPFPFDVHMMVAADDTPSLENALHRELHRLRVNKVKPRKEFFRTNLDAIVKIVRANHGDVQYVADPEALQFRQSIGMSDEDQEYIEQVYDALDEDSRTVADE